MTQSASSIIESIEPTQITAVARQATLRPTLSAQDWKVRQLGGGLGNPVSVGLYRFAGVGQDGDEPVDWSVVLKIVQSPANVGWENMGEGTDQSHWNYWRRELLIYQSGLLQSLPDGLTAPRCYGATELPGHIALLWLEDIQDAYAGEWPLARYGLAARHLGRLNGQYMVERPSYPWFGRQIARQWITMLPQWQTIPWQHPGVLRRYPPPKANSFRCLLLENERFLAALDQLPHTLCHGDTYPTNFMSRRLPGEQEQTVALDWALMGIEAVGYDLGQLVFGAHLNLTAVPPSEITETLFARYLDGLRDAGCATDPQQVRLGFTASAAFRIGLFQVYLLSQTLQDAPEEMPVTLPPDCFELLMAREAYNLL
ncbi:MAG: phosphotransferase [Chloroflexota bacterium]